MPYFDRVEMTDSEKNNLDDVFIYPTAGNELYLLKSKKTLNVLTLLE